VRCSENLSSKECFLPEISKSQKVIYVHVSLNVNDDERNNCGMLIVVFDFCKRFESFDDC
jgi:hypothetical protein